MSRNCRLFSFILFSLSLSLFFFLPPKFLSSRLFLELYAVSSEKQPSHIHNSLTHKHHSLLVWSCSIWRKQTFTHRRYTLPAPPAVTGSLIFGQIPSTPLIIGSREGERDHRANRHEWVSCRERKEKNRRNEWYFFLRLLSSDCRSNILSLPLVVVGSEKKTEKRQWKRRREEMTKNGVSERIRQEPAKTFTWPDSRISNKYCRPATPVLLLIQHHT